MNKILKHTFVFWAALTLAACTAMPMHDAGEMPLPINYPAEVIESVTNDFTLLKACIGKTAQENANIVKKMGYTPVEDKNYPTYTKTENGITKKLTLYSEEQADLYIKTADFSSAKAQFATWQKEIQKSRAYTNMVRSTFQMSTGWGNGVNYFDTPDELISAVNAVTGPEKGMSAVFSGNDCYANSYSLAMSFHDEAQLEMYVYNPRIKQPIEEFTQSDLNEADLHKHILISKVDYLTFRYRGFYALNVSGKLDSGTEIPFVAEYHPAADFGDIKLFYRNKNNLLMSGTIIWMGCGVLDFPASFRAGYPYVARDAFPGQEHFAFINEQGEYTVVTDESDLQHVWQSVSGQQEFQHYYANSSKKVAVYLYRPSIGMGNPADAYYLVFTEQD